MEQGGSFEAGKGPSLHCLHSPHTICVHTPCICRPPTTGYSSGAAPLYIMGAPEPQHAACTAVSWGEGITSYCAEGTSVPPACAPQGTGAPKQRQRCKRYTEPPSSRVPPVRAPFPVLSAPPSNHRLTGQYRLVHPLALTLSSLLPLPTTFFPQASRRSSCRSSGISRSGGRPAAGRGSVLPQWPSMTSPPTASWMLSRPSSCPRE